MKRISVLFSCLVLTLAAVGAQATSPQFKIGMAFDSSGLGDKSFNDSAYEGLAEVAKNFNGYFTTPNDPKFGNNVEIKYAVPRSNSEPDRLAVLRQLAREGYKVIFTIGFTYTDSTIQAAKEFPNVHFVLVDGFIPNLKPNDNITVVNFKEHEGSFLVGMIAGLKNDGGKIGFIGGMISALIEKFESGFRAGAMYVNPALRQRDQILVQYIGNDPSAFNNPNRAYQIARDMYRQGATVIYHAAGGSGLGLFRAAREAQKWAIGVDADQRLVLSADSNRDNREQAQWILTSMLKRVNRPVLLLSRDFIRSGRVAERYQNYGLNFDAVGFAYNDSNRSLLSRDIIQRISDVRVMITNNQLNVPSSRIEVEEWLRTIQ